MDLKVVFIAIQDLKALFGIKSYKLIKESVKKSLKVGFTSLPSH